MIKQIKKEMFVIVIDIIKLPYVPAILMQDVAGNSPSLPFLPPIHGDSNMAVVTLF